MKKAKLRCSKCKKMVDRAVKHGKSKGGVRYYRCNPCNTDHMRKYYRTKKGRERVGVAAKKSYRKYKKKQYARSVLNQAVQVGKVEKPKSCSKCKERKRIDGHHESYARGFELDVIWLCRTCHTLLHKK